MADSTPTRAEVLAWMTRTGGGYKKAAAHFAMSPSTAKYWQQSAKRTASLPPKAVVSSVPKARASRRKHSDNADDDGVEGVVHAATTSDEPSRAMPPTIKATSPSEPPPRKPPGPVPVMRVIAANLPNEDRQHLRNGVRRMLAFLDSQDAIDNPKNAADAARALQTLMVLCPDILSFEDRTSGGDRAAASNTEAENLASVFGG